MASAICAVVRFIAFSLRADSSFSFLAFSSAMQLAKLIGTNRLYLSKHFASQGITYNAYINGLRIQHFINLYHEAVATHQPIAVQQLLRR